MFLKLANSTDPDEMSHFVAFHLGHHCLQKYPFKGLSIYRLMTIHFFNVFSLFLHEECIVVLSGSNLVRHHNESQCLKAYIL